MDAYAEEVHVGEFFYLKFTHILKPIEVRLNGKITKRSFCKCEVLSCADTHLHSAFAICNPSDEYNPEIGRMLSMARAMDVFGDDNTGATVKNAIMRCYFSEFPGDDPLILSSLLLK